MCGYEVGVGGYLPVKLKPEEQTLQVPVGMEGTLQTMSRLEEFNIFVGPSTDFLIKHGAKFGPCMRKVGPRRSQDNRGSTYAAGRCGPVHAISGNAAYRRPLPTHHDNTLAAPGYGHFCATCGWHCKRKHVGMLLKA